MKDIRIFLLGMAGSGKGTISELLLGRLNDSSIKYYNVGGILRSQAHLDQHIKETHAEGGLVAPNRVLGIFEDALGHKQFICDGSPRRPEEASFVLSNDKWKSNPGYLIHLDIDPELAKQRLLSRGRFDDSESTIKRRMVDYYEYTVKSIEKFAEADRLITVDASQTPDQVCAEIVRRLRELK